MGTLEIISDKLLYASLFNGQIFVGAFHSWVFESYVAMFLPVLSYKVIPSLPYGLQGQWRRVSHTPAIPKDVFSPPGLLILRLNNSMGK